MITVPEMIVDYNRNMGGVDHLDQFRGYYNVGRAGRKWWKTEEGMSGMHFYKQAHAVETMCRKNIWMFAVSGVPVQLTLLLLCLKRFPSMPSSKTDIDLDGQWSNTVQGDCFLFGGDGNRTDKTIVFVSNYALHALSNAATRNCTAKN
ncbi:hypothetical protein NP493_2748g00002 [Ridgeia piscesae]|uniref:Uncharacterized protein n=1 Tax=Ridgeia piscesae TaxID=27915 RepID=A0AAD9JD14_RIDPI|nr:hypothetical protein NP493_2748g00002 [Ridgeia piscesae]